MAASAPAPAFVVAADDDADEDTDIEPTSARDDNNDEDAAAFSSLFTVPLSSSLTGFVVPAASDVFTMATAPVGTLLLMLVRLFDDNSNDSPIVFTPFSCLLSLLDSSLLPTTTSIGAVVVSSVFTGRLVNEKLCVNVALSLLDLDNLNC